MHVMTFNLRLDLESDGVNRFTNRLPAIERFLKHQNPDVVFFQEVTPLMYTALKKILPGYDYSGIARREGEEATPIFYRKSLGKSLECNTLWLTDTPELVSKSMNSFFYRIATYVVLNTPSFGTIAFFNTHLDYASAEVSCKQIESVVARMHVVCETYQASAILGGDFNQIPESSVDRYLCGHVIGKHKLVSSYASYPNPGLTYHGYSDQIEGKPIDYLFSTSNLYVSDVRIHRDHPVESFLSDHYPLSLKLQQIERND